MDVRKSYKITFKALNEGIHDFNFTVDDSFFKAFDNTKILSGSANIDIVMSKSANMLGLSFAITGKVTTECDRCLEECELPVNYTGNLVVRFGETEDQGDGDILWLSPSETELDLALYIYESIILGLPYKRVHEDDANGIPQCDPGMLSRFGIVSQEEFDSLTKEKPQKLEVNPQFDKLRELKDKLDK